MDSGRDVARCHPRVGLDHVGMVSRGRIDPRLAFQPIIEYDSNSSDCRPHRINSLQPCPPPRINPRMAKRKMEISSPTIAQYQPAGPNPTQNRDRKRFIESCFGDCVLHGAYPLDATQIPLDSPCGCKHRIDCWSLARR